MPGCPDGDCDWQFIGDNAGTGSVYECTRCGDRQPGL